MPIRIVIDTNVLVSAFRSNRGASFRLLRMVDDERFQLCLSVPIVVEYEAASKRLASRRGLSAADVDRVIDYLCKVGKHFKIHFLWRPILKDPKDDMVLELAVSSSADAIVTFNRKDFKGSAAFGIRILTPQELLREIGEQS